MAGRHLEVIEKSYFMPKVFMVGQHLLMAKFGEYNFKLPTLPKICDLKILNTVVVT